MGGLGIRVPVYKADFLAGPAFNRLEVACATDKNWLISHVLSRKNNALDSPLKTTGAGQNIDVPGQQLSHGLIPRSVAQHFNRHAQPVANDAQVVSGQTLIVIAVTGDFYGFVVADGDTYTQFSMIGQPLPLCDIQPQRPGFNKACSKPEGQSPGTNSRRHKDQKNHGEPFAHP